MNGDPGRELLLLGILRRAPQSAYSLDPVSYTHLTLPTILRV